jgi:uncharacterized membrane protein
MLCCKREREILKNVLLYSLVILLISTIILFVIGFWKMGMLIGFIFTGIVSSVGLIYSLKGQEYVHKSWHHDYVNRVKKYRD